MDLALSAGDTTISSLTYRITGNGFTKEGSIPVTASGNTFSALITGIPSGVGYTIKLTATGDGGELSCTGSAMFDVTAGQTSSVSVGLQCPGRRKTGAVMVNGAINVCAVAEGASSSQSSAAVGATVSLTGLGSDEDSGPDPLSYQWTVVSGPGTLASADQAQASLTCDAAGKVTLKLSVSDGDCGDQGATLEVTCSDGADAGAGGSVADAGAAGSGGSVADAGAAGSGGSVADAGEAGSGGSVADAGEAGSGGSVADAGEAGSGGSGGSGGGCSAGAATPVTIKFRGVVNGAPFACGQNYDNVGSPAVTITPLDFRMFVQDLTLVRSDGVEVPVTLDINAWQNAQVALIDFENNEGNCAEGNPETNTVITGTVPSSSCEYTGVKFANGVPASLNHANPTTFSAPLSSYSALSWGWLTGFRFTKFEVLRVGGDVFSQAYLHSGSQACTGNPSQGTVSCGKPNRNAISLSGFDPQTSTVVVDLAKAFTNTEIVDLVECHSSSAPICTPMFNALGVNFGTGQPQGGQTIFSVE